MASIQYKCTCTLVSTLYTIRHSLDLLDNVLHDVCWNHDDKYIVHQFLDYIKQGLTRSERGQLWSRLLQAESTKEKAKETFKYQVHKHVSIFIRQFSKINTCTYSTCQ